MSAPQVCHGGSRRPSDPRLFNHLCGGGLSPPFSPTEPKAHYRSLPRMQLIFLERALILAIDCRLQREPRRGFCGSSR
jgi:hypothetical protein